MNQTQTESFGKYILLEKLATGGMAEVYLAKSTGASGIAKVVALKRILPQFSDNAEYVEWFKEEAKIAVNLNHSNVVSIFDFGVEKGQFFIVMEYVEGRNIRQILNHLKRYSQKFSIEQIVYIIKEAAAGLDHAHRCLDGATGKPLNITHRDISPQNIMISFEGDIKIVDFGIAKAENKLETTKTGTLKGKYGYMSPEQAEGQNLDSRTDIFSLGIVLWEILANDRLFTSNNELNILKKIRDCQIPSLRKVNPSVHPELERICNKALSKDVNIRYQSASAFNRDLSRFLNTQYPEFSTHDFSIFMKTIFSEVILDNRKKMVEYSKIHHPGEKAKPVEESGILKKQERPARHSESENFSEENSLTISEESTVVNLKDLKIKNKILNTQKRGVNENTNTHSHISFSTSRAPKKPKKQEVSNHFYTEKVSNFLSNVFIFGGIGCIIWFGFRDKIKPYLKPNSTELRGSVNLPATGKATVSIQSLPEGAQIYINDVDTGKATPAMVDVELNKKYKISLKKENYTLYTKEEIATQTASTVTATLMQNILGYLYINVKGSNPNTLISVNGNPIGEKPPIRFFAIPANTAINIKAYDPTTKKSDEINLQVRKDEKKYVELNLLK